MTHSVHESHGGEMRIAALALACFSGAAVATAAAGEARPALAPLPIASSGATTAAALGPTSSISSPEVRTYVLARPREARETREAYPPRGRICFSQAETREKIAQRRLTDPVGVTRSGRAEGEVLRTRLCRWKQDELVYEVTVLRRDGRIARLYIDAQSGQTVSAAVPAEHK